MALEHLEFGDSIAGLLIDGVEETPYIGATLKLVDPDGVRVEVPYITHGRTDQFTHVEKWFDDQAPPDNLQLDTEDGPISLYGLRWSGYAQRLGDGHARGTLTPSETVLGTRDGKLADALEIDTVRSRLDALNRWTRVSAVSEDHDVDERGKVVRWRSEVEGKAIATWPQGHATMSLVASWEITRKEDSYSRELRVQDNVFLESDFPAGARPFFDHFKEQRKLASLLVFVYGIPIAFREHKLRDARFATRMLGGRVAAHPFIELISTLSVRERTLPVLSTESQGQPIAYFAEIGGEGLANWSRNYDQWERFILPSAGVLGRRSAFIEDIVTSTSMSLEAAGQLIGPKDGEDATYGSRRRPTTATFAYRCLRELSVGWGDYIESDLGLARAIANNYNDVKHYDRGDFPAHEQTFLVSHVNRLVVRLLAVRLTGHGEAALERYQKGEELWPLKQRFDASRMRVRDDGSWERKASAS